jgi:VanZ family protein
MVMDKKDSGNFDFRHQAFARFAPATFIALAIPMLSLLPAAYFKRVIPSAAFIPGWDKLIHALLYAALSRALFHALSPKAKERVSCWTGVTLAAGGYGLLMEFFQRGLTVSRGFDWFDALANLLGASIAAGLAGWRVRARHRRQGVEKEKDGPHRGPSF